jgi:tRNA-splicing ligase RtcB (3'-phosphate/5'-hydroxy nucleic acid ligase)
VLIPGDMGRYSYVLVGTEGAFDRDLRLHLPRRRPGPLPPRRQEGGRGHNIEAELAARGILIRAASRATVAEEISEAYKDVMEVVNVVQQAGIGKIVARLKPMAVIKG